MPLPVPASLSPSALASFTGCGLAFRFAYVEQLPEPPMAHLTRGTLVHAALERLFGLDAPDRTPDAAEACLVEALGALDGDPAWTDLPLDDDGREALVEEARSLLHRYFLLEDPRTVQAIGVELKLQATVGGVVLRGIIDRLDLVDGELVVTDYKTGRAPSTLQERRRLQGVRFYALLCQRAFGRRPARVQLLHLAEPVAVIAEPTDQSTRGLERTVAAVWHAVERACEHDDFRPQPSAACGSCAYRRWCPAFGGEPSRARIDIEIDARTARGEPPLLLV